MYSATTHCQRSVVSEFRDCLPFSKRTGSELASLEYLAGIFFRRFSIPNLILFLLFFSDKFFFESTWRQNYWRRPSAPHKTNLILTGEVRPLLDWDSPLCLGGSRLILHGLNGPEEGSTPEWRSSSLNPLIGYCCWATSWSGFVAKPEKSSGSYGNSCDCCCWVFSSKLLGVVGCMRVGSSHWGISSGLELILIIEVTAD